LFKAVKQYDNLRLLSFTSISYLRSCFQKNFKPPVRLCFGEDIAIDRSAYAPPAPLVSI